LAFVAALLVVIAAAAAAAYALDADEPQGVAAVACSGAPVTPGLPSDFPDVEGMTYTKSQTAGPSEIADGYYEGDLRSAYEAWKSALEDAGYTITFDEVEAHDSEVAYRGGADRRSGIVALRNTCKEGGRISVHITSRPA
jgi:hypothetical protein